MKVILTTLLSLVLKVVAAQNNDSLEEIKGPEIYKKEIAKIFEKHDKISDSLTQIAIIHKFKSDTTQIEGYNSKLFGSYIEQEINEIENILSQFLAIKRVSAIYKHTDAINKEYIFTISFVAGEISQRNGFVKWVVGYD